MRLTYAPGLLPANEQTARYVALGQSLVYPEECWRPGADCIDPSDGACPPGYQLYDARTMAEAHPENEPLPKCVPAQFEAQAAVTDRQRATADLIGLGLAVLLVGGVAYLVMRAA